MNEQITFANTMGELLEPILKIVRATGFFEAQVFLTTMTIVSIVLFTKVVNVLKTNGTFEIRVRKQFRKIVLGAYYTLCFIACNAIVVAFKTMIVQEMDYETKVWFLHLVSPLHFYIVSVTGGFIWLAWRNRQTVLDQLLCIYIQIGLCGGYYIAIDRLIRESLDFTDPTSGVSGIFMIVWFGILNTDLVLRFVKIKTRKHNIS